MTSTYEEYVNEHVDHCCVLHGCYCDDPKCPVFSGDFEQCSDIKRGCKKCYNLHACDDNHVVLKKVSLLFEAKNRMLDEDSDEYSSYYKMSIDRDVLREILDSYGLSTYTDDREHGYSNCFTYGYNSIRNDVDRGSDDVFCEDVVTMFESGCDQ